MKQYYDIKGKHPDAILLFRVGDFYETFSDDAIKASQILGITLTKRANGSASYVELAGFPHHALDTYLPKLVRAGQRVAVCEQLEDPKKTKKIVKRGITELVTPGVSINDNILEQKENNFLASVYINKKSAGISLLDISTGEFLTAEGSLQYIDKLISSFAPKEILIERGQTKVFESCFGNRHYIYKLEDWVFTEQNATNRLLNHFNTTGLKGFGIHELKLGIIASGAILEYLSITQHNKIEHINTISRIEEDLYVWLDKFTIRNLELIYPINEGGQTLADILDRTLSPMGARMLKRWIVLPLKQENQIQDRLNTIEYFLKNIDFTDSIRENIRKIGDLERLISKIAVGKINPREVVQFKNALYAIEPIKELCKSAESDTLRNIADQLNYCELIRDRIDKEIVAEPPVLINKGGAIADGINSELDELRNISRSGKDYLIELQQKESEKTGIPSLKIGFNNVFGYYFEVRNTHKDKVPEGWIRKQTLTGAERYITEELKEYETKILGAEEKILSLEQDIYNKLIAALTEYINVNQQNATKIANLDVLQSFAEIAKNNRYSKPNINSSFAIDIKNGRHPVIEKQLPDGEQYVANDVFLDNESQQIMMITGPNMAGKSALLRQTALICLMAQIGSFVPADASNIGIIDKIFTRVGASDNISQGESTFMVEMQEAASIMNNLSDRSLVLLDEIGRGTSTYDGISIAWSMVEFMHEQPINRAKTLFATHYHELNEMEKSFNRVKNYNVSVKEHENKVIFLRKLKKGGSEHSFGIHVAQMAGMPKSVVKRAEKILEDLEKTENNSSMNKQIDNIAENREGMQLSFFQLDDPVLKQIRDEIAATDINNLTPMDALNKLYEIKKLAGLN
ncbi:MAG: DNA mismatch repair protein MutS [Bacteroidales bacterium]|nr:DNA mismatch repair protein MutS [Bacteroidales bacterium]